MNFCKSAALCRAGRAEVKSIEVNCLCRIMTEIQGLFARDSGFGVASEADLQAENEGREAGRECAVARTFYAICRVGFHDCIMVLRWFVTVHWF
jgi:hypothetical protein